MADKINKPAWYAQGGIEPIDFIESNPHLGHHECNIIQYLFRFRQKNGIEDLEKAQWWLAKLIAMEQKRISERQREAVKRLTDAWKDQEKAAPVSEGGAVQKAWDTVSDVLEQGVIRRGDGPAPADGKPTRFGRGVHPEERILPRHPLSDTQ